MNAPRTTTRHHKTTSTALSLALIGTLHSGAAAQTSPRTQASASSQSEARLNPAAIAGLIDRARTEIRGYLPELTDQDVERALARAASQRGVKVHLIIHAGSRARNDSRMNNLVLAGYTGKKSVVTYQEIKLRGKQGEAFLVIDGRQVIYGNQLGYTGGQAAASQDKARISRASSWIGGINSKIGDTMSVYADILRKHIR